MRTRGKKLGLAGIALGFLSLTGCGTEAAATSYASTAAPEPKPVKTVAEITKEYDTAIKKLATESETNLKKYDDKALEAVTEYNKGTVQKAHDFMQQQEEVRKDWQKYQKQSKEILGEIAKDVKGMSE